MADVVRFHDTMVNLDRVEAIKLDATQGAGLPRPCVKVCFRVDQAGHEERYLAYPVDSPTALAIRNWADGVPAQSEDRPALPFVPAPEGPVVIGRVCCRESDQARAWDPSRDGVAEACTDHPGLGRGA